MVLVAHALACGGFDLLQKPSSRSNRNSQFGEAGLGAHVSSDGSVSIAILKSGHPLLLQEAEGNLNKWKFLAGESQEMEIIYHFKLSEPPLNYAQTECAFDLPNSVTISSHVPTIQPNYSQGEKPAHK
jgi:hypothetical protein